VKPEPTTESARVREALRKQRLETGAKEQRDREGYSKQPQSLEESRLWEAEVVWSEE
jgi:hypothetical protein